MLPTFTSLSEDAGRDAVVAAAGTVKIVDFPGLGLRVQV